MNVSKVLALTAVNKGIVHLNVVPPLPQRYLRARARAKEKGKAKKGTAHSLETEDDPYAEAESVGIMCMLNKDGKDWASRGPPLTDEEITAGTSAQARAKAGILAPATEGTSAPTTEERHPFPPLPSPNIPGATPKSGVPPPPGATPKSPVYVASKSGAPVPPRSASVRSASVAASAPRPSQASQNPRRSRSPLRTTWRPSLRDPSPRGAC